MLTFFILFVLFLTGFSHGAAIQDDSDNVAIELAVPRGQTREEYSQSIIDYWTPERMASAVSLDSIIVNENELFHLNNYPKSNRAAAVLASSALLPGMTSTKPLVAGKAYFVMNGANYLCSGSVVNAYNRDTVLTAGHCVFDYDRKIWASSWMFVPQYSLGSRPLGSFSMRRMVTKNGWVNSQNYNFDVGMVLTNRNEKGQHIQDVTGGLGITVDPPRQARVTSFGYPKNLNGGETVSNCAGTPISPTFLAGFTGLQIPCAMTGGASGGPWIQEYDVNARTGQQVSVNSFIVTNRPNNLFGPYFTEDNIGSMYRTYQDQ